MKIIQIASLLALAISVVGGCVLISGQFFIDWDLPNLDITQDALVPYQIDLNEEEDYREHKEDLQGLADLALVGFVRNNTSEPVGVTVYITPTLTSFTSREEVLASSEATRLWGEFAVPANTQKKIEWDDSAGLFAESGYDILIQEIKGDGRFTLYLMGAKDTFDLSTTSNWLLITVDASG